MKIQETIKVAIKALNLNKIRSLLTMLGVIIGVFAVVTLVALGKGIQNYIENQFSSLGSDLIIIAPGKVDFTDDPAKSFNQNKLEQKHIDLIETYANEYISIVTPSLRIGSTLSYKNKNYASTTIGVNEKAPIILNLQTQEGRFFNKKEVKNKDKVVLLGINVQKEFFPNTDPIGKFIKVDDENYEVIGLLGAKNQRFDTAIVVPYTTMMEQNDIENFSSIATKATNNENIQKAMLNIELALRRDLNEDEFSVISQQDILQSIQGILGVLTAAVGAIAGISLVVGGIGIMNIMLVSVTERTREIGLRKALGATNNNIALQFMLESVILSVFGGLIGLFFAIIVSFILNSFIQSQISLNAVILALSFSTLVGVIFGTYPAIKAGQKQPIEALRYE